MIIWTQGHLASDNVVAICMNSRSNGASSTVSSCPCERSSVITSACDPDSRLMGTTCPVAASYLNNSAKE